MAVHKKKSVFHTAISKDDFPELTVVRAKATHKKKPADKIELRKLLDFCKQVFCAIRQDGRLWPAYPIVEVKIQ